MEPLFVLVAVASAAAGVFVLQAGFRLARDAGTDATTYLRSLDEEEGSLDEFQQLLQVPFLSRVVRPLGTQALRGISSVLPSNHLDRVHTKLLHAGLGGAIRAEEFVTAQVLAVAASLVLSVLWVLLTQPAPRLAVTALVGLPVMAALASQSWLERRVAERKESIKRELPDVLDLLAISVEAGTGFEGGLQVVCTHFTSPLAEELSRTLKEMELGLARREALQNLKRRTEVPELSNFVLVLTQADALGMPIGRVLKTQASEMRLRRRQWAREQAGKLPVKILFPLVLFIFPAVFVIVLGPAASTMISGLG